jgi:hypothetical protein
MSKVKAPLDQTDKLESIQNALDGMAEHNILKFRAWENELRDLQDKN